MLKQLIVMSLIYWNEEGNFLSRE